MNLALCSRVCLNIPWGKWWKLLEEGQWIWKMSPHVITSTPSPFVLLVRDTMLESIAKHSLRSLSFLEGRISTLKKKHRSISSKIFMGILNSVSLKTGGVPIVVRQKQIWLVSMKMRVWSLFSLSGSRIWHYCELWCRSQMQLWSQVAVAVAVAVAASCISNSTTSLGTSICPQMWP